MPREPELVNLSTYKARRSRGSCRSEAIGRRRSRRSPGCAACPRGRSPSASRAGRLHTLYRGVYAVGHPTISLRGRCLAAVKACGPGAVISHFAAAFLWGMLEPFTRYPDVTAPTPRKPPGDQHASAPRTSTPRPSTASRSPRPSRPLSTSPRCCRSRPSAAPSTRPSTAASSRRSNSSPPTTEGRRNCEASSPRPPRPAPRTRTSSCTSSTRPESPSRSSTRASALRTRSPTSCGPTATSSWKPTAGATTTT